MASEVDPKFEWLINYLKNESQHRAPNFRIVENGEGLWKDASDFRAWRQRYLESRKLKAYQTRGGGTALASAEIVPAEERIQKVVKYLESRKSQRATNREVKDYLKISDEDWDSVKETMKQQGLLASYRTRGGGVRLLTAETSKTIQSEVTSLREIDDETEFCKRVEKSWALDTEGFDFVYNIFGKLKGSGKWDNPDIFCVRLRSMEYVRSKPCIISAVETKLEFTRQAVLQTYSYLRFCHYAYLVVNLYEDEILNAEDGSLADYATNLGIGVVGLADAKDSASPFVEVIQPRSHIPSLYELDRFLHSHEGEFRKSKIDLDEKYFGASLG